MIQTATFNPPNPATNYNNKIKAKNKLFAFALHYIHFAMSMFGNVRISAAATFANGSLPCSGTALRKATSIVLQAVLPGVPVPVLAPDACGGGARDS